jgi:membrane-associated phospholipid phosphatase
MRMTDKRLFIVVLCGMAVAVALIPVSILFFDRPLASLCDSFPSNIHTVFTYVSLLSSFPVALAASLIMITFFVIRVYGRKMTMATQAPLLFVPATALTSWFVVSTLKYFFGRFRPVMLLTRDLYGFQFLQSGYANTSFPSGHAAIAFSLLLAAAVVRPGDRLALVVLAIIMALSRIIITAHFLSDVLAGAVVGAGMVLVFRLIFRNKGFLLSQRSEND